MPLVVDKSKIVGGGVRTFWHGGHPFTYGPRHFIGPEENQAAFDYLNKVVPMRHLEKMNYSYQPNEDYFASYPIHLDDVKNFEDGKEIIEEINNLPKETKSSNFEEYWTGRVGTKLYERFNKHYNLKAWQLEDNRSMDFGFEATVKRKPLETGSRYEFSEGYINAYPLAKNGYNDFFEFALNGSELVLGNGLKNIDLDKKTVYLEDGAKISGDLVVNTISPDILLDNCYGELAYVGRDFYKIVLPNENVLPKDVYFIYYPNLGEQQTRVTEFKKFTLHESKNSLITLEVPSMRNKLYPTMIKAEVEKAEKYINELPEGIISVGRMGTYRYVDIDDIIMQGLEFKKNI